MKKEHTLQFMVTEHEKALIEKVAKQEDTTVSKYVRGCVLMSMALDGNTEAIKLIATIVQDKSLAALRRQFSRSPKLVTQ